MGVQAGERLLEVDSGSRPLRKRFSLKDGPANVQSPLRHHRRLELALLKNLQCLVVEILSVAIG